MLQIIASIILLGGEILYLLQDFKKGLLAGFLALGLTADVFPWYLLPISGVATLSFLGFAAFSIFYIIRPQYNAQRNIDVIIASRGYLLLLIVFVSIALLYVWVAGVNSEYGLDKTLLVILRGIIPVFIFRFLVQDTNDFKIIFYTFVATSLLGTAFLLTSDVRDAYAISLDQVNTIVAGRIVGIGAVVLGVFLVSIEKLTWKHYLFTSPIFLGLIVGTLLTGSRGPLTGILATLLMFLLLSARLHSWTRTSFLLLGSLLVALVLTFFVNWTPLDILSLLGQNRIISTVLYLNFERFDSGRIEFYVAAIDAIFNTSAIGIGTGGFGNVMGGYIGRIYPHNIFLEITLEQGFIGLTVLCTIVSTTFYRCVKIWRDLQAAPYLKCVAAIWVYSLYNAQFSGDIGANYQFWATGGLVWIAYSVAAFEKNSVAKSSKFDLQSAVIQSNKSLSSTEIFRTDSIALEYFEQVS